MLGIRQSTSKSCGVNTKDYPDNMLFYHSLDYSSMMTVGVTYKVSRSGVAKFDANWTCDN